MSKLPTKTRKWTEKESSTSGNAANPAATSKSPAVRTKLSRGIAALARIRGVS